jgi:hypothetical protein
MDGKSFLPMVLSAESLLPPSSHTAATTAAAAAAAAVPGSVLRYAHAHPAASVRSSWRDTHFIEYYYIGIGGYCGMLEPIEQPDNNFIAIRCANATCLSCLVLSCRHHRSHPSIHCCCFLVSLTFSASMSCLCVNYVRRKVDHSVGVDMLYAEFQNGAQNAFRVYLCITTIDLPRQARDKQKETLKTASFPRRDRRERPV